MWYGEPLILTAALSRPQSLRVAMCPPQASTGFGSAAVDVNLNVKLRRASFPSGPPYDGTKLVKVAPKSVRLPATGVTPAAVTSGSVGIAFTSLGPAKLQPAMGVGNAFGCPAHGSASVTVRSKLVM